MFRKITVIVLATLAICSNLWSQKDSASVTKPKLSTTGFIDVFYSYDFNEPESHYRQPFLYNHNRHNEINVNLALIKFAITLPRYRANIALQAGTYVEDNYANEPRGLQHISEASIGIALNRKGNLWLDAGVLPSHIGFESAISKDSWTLTRSLLAENSPYYLTGAKLTYSPKPEWELAALICNGWQVIHRSYGNAPLAAGSQIKFIPNKKYTFNWSTYVGTEDTGSTRTMRYFSNFFAQMQLTKKVGVTIGFDLGLQQKRLQTDSYENWISPVAIVRYSVNEKWAMAVRGELYQDYNSVIISTPTGSFNTIGTSVNLDYSPVENVFCRIEGRWLHDEEKIYARKNQFVRDNYFITTSLAVSF